MGPGRDPIADDLTSEGGRAAGTPDRHWEHAISGQRAVGDANSGDVENGTKVDSETGAARVVESGRINEKDVRRDGESRDRFGQQGTLAQCQQARGIRSVDRAGDHHLSVDVIGLAGATGSSKECSIRPSGRCTGARTPHDGSRPSGFLPVLSFTEGDGASANGEVPSLMPRRGDHDPRCGLGKGYLQPHQRIGRCGPRLGQLHGPIFLPLDGTSRSVGNPTLPEHDRTRRVTEAESMPQQQAGTARHRSAPGLIRAPGLRRFLCRGTATNHSRQLSGCGYCRSNVPAVTFKFFRPAFEEHALSI